jgi:hypothetical protein
MRNRLRAPLGMPKIELGLLVEPALRGGVERIDSRTAISGLIWRGH